MRRVRLGELVGRLRGGGLEPTAEQVADAVWLAQWLPHGPGPATPGPGDPDAPSAHPDERPDAARDAPRPPGARTDPDHGSAHRPARGTASGTVPLHLPADASRTDRTDTADGEPAFRVRAPAAAALPGLLGLQRALRPLSRYGAAPARPGDGRLDEEATAQRTAMTGVLAPVLGAARRHRADLHLLMDTGPAMAVWERMVEELRQACEQSGVFRDVQVHQLHAPPGTGDEAPLIGTASGPGRHTRLRPADQFHDPTGRRLTLVVSDCVGPLWQRGSAQRLLHGWPRAAPLAVVQPLPPRLWGRTALPAEPGLLVRAAEPGGHTTFQPDEPPWLEQELSDGNRRVTERPVPVLQPTPEAFAAWARLLSGPGGGAERVWAARVRPPRTLGRGAEEATVAEAALRAGAGAGAGAGARPAAAAVAGRSAEESLRAFRATASPGAVRLAVHLAAAPLVLPVMQLVQRAMVPDTGPTELAEVLLGGLLQQLPGTESRPCFVYPERTQELLLASLNRDVAGLVLKHCSAYVERHFGKGTRNFAALAAARLAGQEPDQDAARPADGDAPHRVAGGVESELFAQIPARVLGFYRPEREAPPGGGAGPTPVAAAADAVAKARRLLGQWREQGDPSALRRAKDSARAALRDSAGEVTRRQGDAMRAGIVLGQVLRAEAGTASVRGAEQRVALLREAVEVLAQARGAAAPGSAERAESSLELAAVHHELWKLTDDGAHLRAALDVLAGPADEWPEASRRTLRLRRGTLLLADGQPAAAVPELQAGCALLEAEEAPDSARCPPLLDLAEALRAGGAAPAETAAVLARAEEAAGGEPELRLRVLAAQASLHDANGDHSAADHCYEAASRLAAPDSPARSTLLTAWGESLLRRAAAPEGGAVVDRAERVLREALTALPARSPARGRLQGLVGSALAQRFRHLGFLPDLFESRHLLRQVVRGAADLRVRAEAWLQLGRVALEVWRRAGAPVRADALQAYRQAEEDALEAYGEDRPGAVTVARALHGQGAVLALMGRPDAARGRYEAAAAQWQRLVAQLHEVDWADVELTRRRAREPEVAQAVPVGADQWQEDDWNRASPPWWPWGGGA
ncbi:SAV_2336 N-terminal domain-related protein [Actinomycetota bacterium Odt1-20B]